MSDVNGGFISLEPFKCRFQYAEGTRPLGAPRSAAGANVEMNWNQAILAQAQGHGQMQIGHRPHHARPSLMGRQAPNQELQPDDGLDAVERARLRVQAKAGANGNASIGGRGSSSSTAKQQRSNPVMPVRQAHRPLELSQEQKVPVRQAHTPVEISQEQKVPVRRAHAPLEVSQEQKGDPIHSLHEAQKPLELAVQENKAKTTTAQLTHSTENADDLRWELAAEANEAIGGVSRAWRLLRMRLASGKVGSSKATVVKISDSVLYVGETMQKKTPHGQGVLCLADGAQHAGHFKQGRADGPGVYLTPQGNASQGSWQENKRVGDFVVLDSKGVMWIEKYNEQGKKTSRKKSDANQESASSSKYCASCGHQYHVYFNHSYACRKHTANWVLDRENSDDTGVWACCGARDKNDQGCDFSCHIEGSSAQEGAHNTDDQGCDSSCRIQGSSAPEP